MFEDKILIDANGCWLWQGNTNPSGYGQTIRKGVHYYIHRLSYEHHVGPIPKGLTIDHLCRVRHCINPTHLEPVTRGENVLRGESTWAQNARKNPLRARP